MHRPAGLLAPAEHGAIVMAWRRPAKAAVATLQAGQLAPTEGPGVCVIGRGDRGQGDGGKGGEEGAAGHGSKPRMMRLHELRTVPRMACAT